MIIGLNSMNNLIPYRIRNIFSLLVLIFVTSSCVSQWVTVKKDFSNPPAKYRPMPFWHLNGDLATDGINSQLEEAKEVSGFGGVTVLPVTPRQQWGSKLMTPGTTPVYLSDEYFARYEDILIKSKSIGNYVILYDDIDFPSGSAGGKLNELYPQFTRKSIKKTEYEITGNQLAVIELPDLDQYSSVLAISAYNPESRQVIDLSPYMSNKTLRWNAPEGNWKVLYVFSEKTKNHPHSNLVDYMQPEAVNQLLKMTYDEYAKYFSDYFGNIIPYTFFDDVGFVHHEEMWTPTISEVFKEKYGKNPALYYPALYYDIGAETQAARVAFFDIRSELLAEGYVKKVAEWSEKRKMKSMGHPPENYSPNSVVAHGDILKYYKHVQIPLFDAIFHYGRGTHGFKQVSSAADLGDKPLVAAELCGAFPSDMDAATLNRVVLEAFARGANLIIPHGMWYDTNPDKIAIPPLISSQNNILKESLHDYSDLVGRASMLLRGGKRIADIAVLYPIAAVQGESTIGRDANSGLPVANWVPDNVTHHKISDILTNKLLQDFTFIHPENLQSGKIQVRASELYLNNSQNSQNYKLLIIPGGDVISAEALEVIYTYYKQGGKVIAVSSLPFKSSEFEQDSVVERIMSDLFGNEYRNTKDGKVISNENGGKFVFIKEASSSSLQKAFLACNNAPDLISNYATSNVEQKGYINYMHKNKSGKEIYYLSNTTDSTFEQTILLRGNLSSVEIWNPHTGVIVPINKTEKEQIDTTLYTKIPIRLNPIEALFIIAKK